MEITFEQWETEPILYIISFKVLLNGRFICMHKVFFGNYFLAFWYVIDEFYNFQYLNHMIKYSFDWKVIYLSRWSWFSFLCFIIAGDTINIFIFIFIYLNFFTTEIDFYFILFCFFTFKTIYASKLSNLFA